MSNTIIIKKRNKAMSTNHLYVHDNPVITEQIYKLPNPVVGVDYHFALICNSKLTISTKHTNQNIITAGCTGKNMIHSEISGSYIKLIGISQTSWIICYYSGQWSTC